MPHVFVSPYLPLDKPARWLKGNHHGHSTLSDGADTPEDNLRAYEAAGYAYFAMSEHDVFIDPELYRAKTAMTLLPAVEVTSSEGQTLMFLGAGPDIPPRAALSLAEINNYVQQRGGLFVVDHPNWLFRTAKRHAEAEELLALPSLGAIEIYTGTIERMAGDPHALDVWDILLSAGRVVHGHATDDQHSAVDHFLGWNCVQWPVGEAPTAVGIIEALRAGRLYASTGVTIGKIGLANNGREIVVESDADMIRWIVRDGMLADVTMAGDARFTIDRLLECDRLLHPWRTIKSLADALYVRAEMVGRFGRKAWSQPFFIRPES